MGFDHVGVFTYSHEEGTSAHDLADDVPAATKKKRQDRLMARQRDLVAARQRARIGERTRLVVDGRSPEHELVVQGRLPGQAPDIDPVVYLTDCDPSEFPKGAFIDVEIVGFAGLRPDRAAGLITSTDPAALRTRVWNRAVARRAKADVLHCEVGY